MPSSTSNSAPSGFGKALRTSLHCSSGELFIMATLRLGKSIFALGKVIQGSPKQPIDDDDEQTHGANPQDDAVEVSRRRRFRDIGPKATSLYLSIPPGR